MLWPVHPAVRHDQTLSVLQRPMLKVVAFYGLQFCVWKKYQYHDRIQRPVQPLLHLVFNLHCWSQSHPLVAEEKLTSGSAITYYNIYLYIMINHADLSSSIWYPVHWLIACPLFASFSWISVLCPPQLNVQRVGSGFRKSDTILACRSISSIYVNNACSASSQFVAT